MTGRRNEAGRILRTFAQYLRGGLIPICSPKAKGTASTIPPMPPYGFSTPFHDTCGLRTIDNAAAGAAQAGGNHRHHRNGTRFGIGMDPKDALLRQGQQGYQLTWMDAKVETGGTPRRGKAVEINALGTTRCGDGGWLKEAGQDAAGAV